ncbi:hypothetical protein SETIT_7G210900v2 [Setaria italica]|uniref:Uncharacterized protein n=1 Tax=Setaria italica TaxID=4555 RepID=A0A368RY28_SETIT|nr:hypothetical protein SETIT_7G210900v2 [Setaria italica]
MVSRPLATGCDLPQWSLRAADDGLAFVFPVRRRGVCSLRSFLPLSPRLRLTLSRFAHHPLESLVFDPNLCQSGGHQNPILNSLNHQPNSRSGCQHEQRPTTARGNASKQRFFMNPLAKLPWIWVRSCSLTLGCWWTASLKVCAVFDNMFFEPSIFHVYF